MKLEMITGCICDSMTIDGKELSAMNDSEQRILVNKICDWLKHNSELSQLLQYVLDYHGTYESLGSCEQCGDFIDKYTLEI